MIKIFNIITYIGFFGSIVSFIVFLLLKIFNVISWSWWLVFLPLGIFIGMIILLLAFLGIQLLTYRNHV